MEDNNHKEDPQIFSVNKRLGGRWEFSRRDFLMATTAAAAVTLVGISGSKGMTQSDELCNVLAHDGTINALAVSLDGSTLVSGGLDKRVNLWALPEGGWIQTLEGHTDGIYALALSPDNTLLASAGFDNTIILWSLPSGEMLATLEGHTDGIRALAISPDGTVLASAGMENTIRLWSLPGGEPAQVIEAHSRPIYALAMTTDGLLVSASADKTVKLWSLSEGELVQTLEGHAAPILALEQIPGENILATASWDRTIKLWSLPEGELIQTLEGHTDGIVALAAFPDGVTLLSASRAEMILWHNGELVKTTPFEEGQSATALTALSDAAYLMATESGTLSINAVDNGTDIHCMVDMGINPNTEGINVELQDGRTVTLPYGTTLPIGAICICNTVTTCSCVGYTCGCVGHRSGGTYWYPN